MSRSAPNRSAASVAHKPTAPSPITATVPPGRTPRILRRGGPLPCYRSAEGGLLGVLHLLPRPMEAPPALALRSMRESPQPVPLRAQSPIDLLSGKHYRVL